MSYGVALVPLLAGVLAAQSGTAPKASVDEYPVHARLEKLSIGAEYLVHSFSGGRETFIARDYLVVEVALFPAEGETLAVNSGQFSLRVNGRKDALAPQAPEFVAASLKYPDWTPHPRAEAGVGPVIFGTPTPTERFPGDPQGRTGPPVPKAPDDNPSGLEKEPPVTAEELVVQTALPEGERREPASGYLYFAYRGKIKGIHKLELEFAGPAGHALLQLQ
jgi:hypothetical protein